MHRRSWASVLLASFASLASARAQDLPLGFALETVVQGLGNPVAAAFAPDGRVFVAEKDAGTVRIVQNGALLPDPLLATPPLATASEQGLLGLALDPAFAENGRLYVYYTELTPRRNRVVRYTAVGNAAGDPVVLLDDIPANTNHNGGTLAFAPDGTLLVQAGDSLVCGAAQSLASLSGKVLRIAVDGSVPPDNPFLGVGGARPEVFTLGHRNGFGLAPDFFAPAPLRVYVSENGPGSQDEVNLALAGRNFGWGALGLCGNGPGFTEPLFLWTLPVPPRTVAPTGIVRYRGAAYPPDYGGDLLVAHLRAERSGILLQRLRLNEAGDAILGDEPFLSYGDGAITNPVALLEEPDGTVYFTAFAPGGTLFRVDFPLGRAVQGALDATAGDAVRVARTQAGLDPG